MSLEKENDPEHVQLVERLHAAINEFAEFVETLEGPGASGLLAAAVRLRDEVAAFIAEKLQDRSKISGSD